MTRADGLSRFASFDGREIAYLDTGGSPGAPLALLLHGFGSTHRFTWVEPGAVDALVATGRRVVAWDARGHGASARPHEVAAYAGDAMVRDAGALLDHLRVTEPRAVDVVGYSMGSLVATRWVPGDARVRSLVLGGVGVHIADGSRDALRGWLARYLAVDDASTIDNAFVRGVRADLEARGNDCKALAALDAAGQDDPTPEHLAALAALPVMVLTGAGDSLVGSPHALAERIPGAVTVTVPGDHPDAMRHPAFLLAVVEFVTTTPSEVPAP